MSNPHDRHRARLPLPEKTFLAPANAYARGLADALLCVVYLDVQLVSGEGARCTGWMLTPNLVLCPGFVGKYPSHSDGPGELERLTVTAFDSDEVVWEQVIDAGSEIERVDLDEASRTLQHDHDIALVKLKQPVSIPQLQLRSDAPATCEPVSMIVFTGERAEAMLSQGQLLEPDDHALRYDAFSAHGSSGAPVFDAHWRIVGMHLGAIRQGSPVGFGLDLVTLLALFQRSRHWMEIARYYRLVDLLAGNEALARDSEPARVAPKSLSVETALLRAAVSAAFDPATLAPEEREALLPLVVDAAAEAWTLQPGARRQVLDGSVRRDVLRGLATNVQDSPAQRMIARILAGPPYSLEDIPDDELPWWLQGAHAFVGVAPDLPAPAQIESALQRRRLRSRLATIAGADFLGRNTELKALHEWFGTQQQQLLQVWGIGGVGKSALIARFAQGLPATAVLLWLDFDRADIAADDAPSILRALHAQARVQLDGIHLPSSGDDGAQWQQAADEFSATLARAADGKRLLLVLDSFEVAQHRERYQELWPLLERMSRQLPALRIVVSGRARVPALPFAGSIARELALRGLKPHHAKAWLRRHGIAEPAVIAEIVRLSRGLPLILHLAAQLVERGGDVSDVPKALTDSIVAGFLYGRILGRIQDAALKPLARATLVLRRIAAELLQPLFGDLIDLSALPAQEWMRRFAREVALVDGETVLRLRDEIRTPALELLEHSDPELVREIDRRAERWYAAQASDTPEHAAELVYHRLRLGDIDGAQASWRDGCGAFLEYAEETLPAAAAEWLRGRRGLVRAEETDTELWELDATERIRAARRRGRHRLVAGILAERYERTPGSPLLFHEAFEQREAGAVNSALSLLNASSGRGASAQTRRDRAMLKALLLSDSRQKRRSDRLLGDWCTPERWPVHQFAELELVAISAAKIRRNTDFFAERALANTLRASLNEGRMPSWYDWLSWLDVMHPELEQALESSGRPRDIRRLFVDSQDFDGKSFLRAIESRRQSSAKPEPAGLLELRRKVLAGAYLSSRDWPDAVPPLLARVLENAWRRWAIIAEGYLLASFQRLGKDGPEFRLSKAVLGVQALVVRNTFLDVVCRGGLSRIDGLDAVADAIEDLFDKKTLSGQVRVMVERRRQYSSYMLNKADPLGVRNALFELFELAQDPLIPLVDLLAGRLRE